MKNDSRILLGEIIGAFGIKGEVRIKSYCELPEAIANYGLLTTCDRKTVLLENVRSTSKDQLVACIEGVSSRQQAEGFIGAELYADRSSFPAPNEGEYYMADLQGLQAFDRKGNLIGEIVAAHNFGAGDMIDIALANANKSIFIPFDRESVVAVEIENGRVVLDPPDGTI
ncbi:MAG: ribosome maturation factor RimM [Albidovulum sp.]|nr:ribosome maturation factor RimM [Albidovulum sp.]MDE0534535.1 ribosome maturation factor RimM [Albidovulum sp.]